MATSRREFLHRSALGAGAVGLALTGAVGRSEASAAPFQDRPPSRKLKLLILGGTGFIGPHQVSYARARGHEITLFNRGRTAPDLFPGVETLIGDRNGDYASIEEEIAKGRTWDVVIDNPATDPEWVKRAAALLRPVSDQYIYVSSISAYRYNDVEWADESAPRHTVENTTEEERQGALSYGWQKTQSEEAAMAAYPGKATIVRPGLIVGPGDRSDRFTWWPYRIQKGGEILCPGPRANPVQIIDARDLSEWMIRMAEDGETGAYNATGPESEMTMDQMLYGIRAVCTGKMSFTWVDQDFLAEHRVGAWMEMPVWVPFSDDMKGFSRWSIQKALDKGLTFRPLAVTAEDTLEMIRAWPAERRERLAMGRSEENRRGTGLTPEKEARILEAWHARRGSS